MRKKIEALFNVYTPICSYYLCPPLLHFQCPKPVIVAIHNACVGGGVDLVSACDIRYATQDAWFQIKVRSDKIIYARFFDAVNVYNHTFHLPLT